MVAIDWRTREIDMLPALIERFAGPVRNVRLVHDMSACTFRADRNGRGACTKG